MNAFRVGKIEWTKSIENVAKDLIRKLLVIDRTKRIGNLKNGADDIKNHKWFKGHNANIKNIKISFIGRYNLSTNESSDY